MSLSLPDDYAALKHIFCEFPIEIDINTIIEMFSNRDHIKYLMSNWSFWNWAQRIERAREFRTITFYMVRCAQRK